MKIIATEIMRFKKEEVYGVDALADFPIHYYSDYFYDDEAADLDISHQHHASGKYELGSAKCKKSVEIHITIKS